MDSTRGFPAPVPSQQRAQQRTTLALIAIAALAISTVIAATVVTIGIARAGMSPASRDIDTFTAARPLHHLWKTKTAPAAISEKPIA